MLSVKLLEKKTVQQLNSDDQTIIHTRRSHVQINWFVLEGFWTQFFGLNFLDSIF